MTRDLDPAARYRQMVQALRADGLSYGKIAALTGVSRASAFRADVGETRQPSARNFLRVEAAYRTRQLTPKRK